MNVWLLRWQARLTQFQRFKFHRNICKIHYNEKGFIIPSEIPKSTDKIYLCFGVCILNLEIKINTLQSFFGESL